MAARLLIYTVLVEPVQIKIGNEAIVASLVGPEVLFTPVILY